jgi:hypothetical protein
MMKSVLAALPRLRDDPNRLQRHFAELMLALFHIYCHRDVLGGSVPAERVDQFRRASAKALAGFSWEIYQYVWVALCEAENGHEEDYYRLCQLRSAIQVVLDNYPGAPVAEIGPTTVADLDVELHRLVGEYGAVAEAFIPPGLPASHWWWRNPVSH